MESGDLSISTKDSGAEGSNGGSSIVGGRLEGGECLLGGVEESLLGGDSGGSTGNGGGVGILCVAESVDLAFICGSEGSTSGLVEGGLESSPVLLQVPSFEPCLLELSLGISSSNHVVGEGGGDAIVGGLDVVDGGIPGLSIVEVRA